MSDTVSVALKKSTYDALEARVQGFGASADDVIMDLIEQNKTLLEKIGQPSNVAGADDKYTFGNYVIHKLPKGKILVTENGCKISNMKKVLREAGHYIGVPKQHLDPNHTTYEIGRNLFKHLHEVNGAQ